jgi:hypothetical protein
VIGSTEAIRVGERVIRVYLEPIDDPIRLGDAGKWATGHAGALDDRILSRSFQQPYRSRGTAKVGDDAIIEVLSWT